jgi:hypothetical protein
MASTEENPKSERKKMIAALALGFVALLTLWYAFFGSTPKATPQANRNVNGGGPAPRNSPAQTGQSGASVIPARDPIRDEASPLPPSPIVVNDTAPPGVPEASRNIFAYYVPPPTPPPPTPTPLPPPTPTPTPPVMVAAVSPANVYARTADFKLDVSGDKFTPQMRVYIDGREVETRYISPQRLSATVPAAVIASEGARQITVRTPDGTLYSNNATLSVAAPPVPNYTYVGLIGGQRYNDTAILKDKSSRNLINVQRGDTVSNRFRVTSISQREVVLIDTSLRVQHKLPLTTESGSQGGPQRIPQQPITDGDGDDP